MHIVPVDIDSITEHDLRLLAKLDTIGFEKRTAEQLLFDIKANQKTLWRLGDIGIMLTSLSDDSLWVEGVAGRFDFKAGHEVRDWLYRLKERAGKYHVRLAVNNIRLQRVYQRLGFVPVATIMEA